MRRLVLFAVMLIVGMAWGRDASAQPVSRNNPYRSFNISGINYGSQRWEREHRGARRQPYRASRFIFRRW
jgi:hypothetical protein